MYTGAYFIKKHEQKEEWAQPSAGFMDTSCTIVTGPKQGMLWAKWSSFMLLCDTYYIKTQVSHFNMIRDKVLKECWVYSEYVFHSPPL